MTLEAANELLQALFFAMDENKNGASHPTMRKRAWIYLRKLR
jgi:hypothetical protein